jgi:hypothetical protein
LLERNDETCEGTWSLIRMLATNQHLYVEILKLSQDGSGKTQDVDWQSFFEGKSIFMKTYM